MKQDYGRAPRGARGLKFVLALSLTNIMLSCPSRGTWIEMFIMSVASLLMLVVPLAGHVD